MNPDHDVLLPLRPASHDDRRLRERVAAVHLPATNSLSEPQLRYAARNPCLAVLAPLQYLGLGHGLRAATPVCKGSVRPDRASDMRLDVETQTDVWSWAITSGAGADRRKRTECLYALTRNRPYLVGKLVSATNVVCDSSNAALPSANAASGSSWATSVGPFPCWYRSRSASLDMPIGFGLRWIAQPVMRGPSRLTTLQPLLPLSGAVQDVLQSRLDCALLAASAGLLHVILVSGLLSGARIDIPQCNSCWSMSD